MTERGFALRSGLLVRVGGDLRFLPAQVALRVAALPPITFVPGAPAELLGVAMYEGVVLPVLAIGTRRDKMIICRHAGELLGLTGMEVVRAGSVDEGQAEELELAALYAEVEDPAGRGLR